MFKYNTPTSLRFVVRAAEDTINGVRIIKPSILNWDTSLVSVTSESIKATFLGDSIQITNVNVIGQDSLVVTIVDVNAVDTTNIFSVAVQTYKGTSQFGQISFLPQLFVYGSPRLMSQVKAKDGSGTYLLNSKYVVVEGVVTAANEFGSPMYLQDESAGIAVYDSSVSNNVERGDRVILLGKVSPYYEMFELNPCSIIEKVSEGNAFDTLALTISEIISQPQNGFEPYECRLVRINNITSIGNITGQPTTPWTVENGKSGSNYKIIVGANALDIRIIAKTNLANTIAPNPPFDVVGVLGQYLFYYQILPRSIEDIIAEGLGPHITIAPPYESNITSTGITLNWTTDILGNSIVIYGTTTAYGDTVRDMNLVTQHNITLNGLKPATVYQVKLASASESGITYTPNYITSTSSQSSTGTINVYFNQSVDTLVSRGEKAQTLNIYQKLVNRINAATYSVDAALYSLSGSVGTAVASALVNAKNRIGRVRVIGEKDNSNTSPWRSLSNNGVPLIFDDYDAINIGAGYMHNKFVVIDNQDTTSDTDDWLWTGSWNATESGNNNDAQNIIEIQDKSLANAYTIEFNEMWGSNTQTPNAANSRFGAHKLNNTPHYFVVNGTPIELYFSPSDGTTGKIIKTLYKATESIDFALLTFTRNDIANVLTTIYRSGIKVRGVIDNRTDSGSEYDTLFARGIDIHLKANLSGLLHHKYAVIDANGNDANKYLITGSHNWSSSAENSNNENTLIIQSSRLVNLYLQEFSVRYKDAGGTDVLVNVEQVGTSVPKNYELTQNYPNPFNPTTSFKFYIPHFSVVNIKIFDLLGREIATLVNESKPAGVYKVNWNASNTVSGVYFYRLQAGSIMLVKKLMLLK
jgi:phosphatidylserine/phosphatidylglycerophosphate/cardiolipin synthase-like enzyme